MFSKGRSSPGRWLRNKVIVSFKARDAVALTFDDGPDPHYTPQVISILQKHRAKATFFTLGRQAELYPRVMQQILNAGSEIANHSYSHPSFSLISPIERLAELRNCNLAIGKFEKKYFRPPFGHASYGTPFWASLLNYKTICWSADAQDWEISDPNAILQLLEKNVAPGSIVLLHDRIETATDAKFFAREAMLEALDRFLDKSVLSFKTLSEMFASYEAVESDWDRHFPRNQRHLRERDFLNLKRNIP
jgi:peptidoglycan/xylan/chitin deacetylase (PgdA/CDA1 family)